MNDELYEKYWNAKVEFAKAVMGIELALESDMPETILDELHKIADKKEQEYHNAFFAWLEDDSWLEDEDEKDE